MPEPPLDVPFGGLNGLVHPNRVPFGEAITATDCFLDDDTVSGRSGYRSLLSTFIASTGNPQFIGRFQPSLSVAAQTVVVVNGNIWLITEATTELLSNGSATELASGVFGASDNISGAQLAQNFYLATDNATPKWVRINSSFALEVLAQLPTAPQPTFTLSSLDLIYFNSLASPTLSGITVSSTSVTDWEQLSGAAGSTAIYDLTTGGGPAGGYAWENTKWVMMTLSPETISGGNTNFSVMLTDVNGGTYPLGTISDPPNTNGSPWCCFFYLVGLNIAANIKYGTFTQGTKPNGGSADPFCISGFMAFSTPPEPGAVEYYVAYYNSVTGATSALSPQLTINYSTINPPVFPTTQAGRWNYNSFQGIGVRSTNPDSMSFSDMWNRGEGLAFPSASDFAPVYTFEGTIPTGAQYNNADTVQLYRSTPDGISLVGSSVYSTDGTAANAKRADGSAWTTGTGTASDLPSNVTYWQSSGTTWAITDNTGDSATANQLYQAGGPGPRTTCMCAIADRLVAAYANTVYISSFTPITAASDLIPQWPPIAVQDADGWSFNLDPAPTENILSVIAGDALYILTDQRVEVLRDLTPGTVPYEVLNRGIVGRQAAVYAEDQLMWAAFDGVYSAQNVSQTAELSQDIRIYVWQQNNVTAQIALGYQLRKLYVFNTGGHALRYDFVTQKWTANNYPQTVFAAISFPVDLGSNNSITYQMSEQMWALTTDRYVERFQPFCVTDNAIGSTPGQIPPPWVYSTGFSRTPKPGFIKELSVLASGFLTVKVAKTLAALEKDEARMLATNDQSWRTEVDFPGPTDLRGKKFRLEFSAVNTVTLYTAYMQREEMDVRGG